MDELFSQSDRGCGIIGGAIVEDALTDLIRKRLIGGSTAMERLFSYEKNGPLSVFSAKIDIAHAIGLISMPKRTDLHAIRQIRNRFAHRIEPLDFADPKIAAWCHSLKSPMGFGHDTPRAKYLSGVGTITLLLMWTREAFTQPLTEIMSGVSDEALDASANALLGTLDALPEESP